MSQFVINTANKRVLTSYLLTVCFRTLGDAGVVNETAIWYMAGYSWAVIARDVNKMQSVEMRCLCTFGLKAAVHQSH